MPSQNKGIPNLYLAKSRKTMESSIVLLKDDGTADTRALEEGIKEELIMFERRVGTDSVCLRTSTTKESIFCDKNL